MMLIIIIVQDYFDDNYCHIFYDNNCTKFVQIILMIIMQNLKRG